jgi:hypothetical protein
MKDGFHGSDGVERGEVKGTGLFRRRVDERLD